MAGGGVGAGGGGAAACCDDRRRAATGTAGGGGGGDELLATRTAGGGGGAPSLLFPSVPVKTSSIKRKNLFLSRIYAQTLMSNQARWLNFSNNSDSNALEETVGTRVLIPVPVGLVDLFVAKQEPEDQQIIDYITAQCSIILEQVMVHSNNMDPNFSVNVNEIQSNPFLLDKNREKDHNNPFQPATSLENPNLPYDVSVDRIRLCNSPTNFLQPFKNDSFFDGSNELFLVEKLLAFWLFEGYFCKCERASKDQSVLTEIIIANQLSDDCVLVLFSLNEEDFYWWLDLGEIKRNNSNMKNN
ncbi:hypothetical protein HYC85_017253 [Camellia sinensis]|uniref:Uncharacterized protein n=1 Tax=Camellia sinensis TaxID=4442 RepID=A0A7J7H3A1_CAMSI|nr:hypothetical protein HYC85_017253 [Camellia sinensis]